MTTAERLAAYLSGDLTPDEQSALEAELAGDAALRTQLDQIAAADQALADLEDVEPSAAFSERLRTAVDAELDRVLGDELAARRARRDATRRLPPWTAIAGAAAAVVAVVVGGTVVLGGNGSDDDAGRSPFAATVEDGAADSGLAEEGTAESEAAMEPAPGAEMLDAPVGLGAAGSPLLVDDGRTVGAEDLTALASDSTLLDALGPEGATALRSSADEQVSDDYAQRYMAGGTTPASDDADGGEAGAEQDVASGPDGVEIRGDVDDADRAAVAACLPTVLEAEVGTSVPVYAELATDQDGLAVVIVAVLADGPDGTFARVWMLDRASCQLLERVEGPALG